MSMIKPSVVSRRSPVVDGICCVLLAASALLYGCSSEVGGGGSGASSGSSSSSGSFDGGPPCEVTGVTGTIPGVTLSISSSRCVYKVGEAAEFTYEVTTDSTVPPIEIKAGSGCGPCTKASEDPLSLTSYQIGGTAPGGQSQNYCLCDVGCCLPEEADTIMLPATTVSDKIQWSGRNWSGPSDTGNPEGDFFLPGKYGVNVSFNGRDQGSVMATLPIEIVP
jgi:hypothetical protein